MIILAIVLVVPNASFYAECLDVHHQVFHIWDRICDLLPETPCHGENRQMSNEQYDGDEATVSLHAQTIYRPCRLQTNESTSFHRHRQVEQTTETASEELA